ncbi:unnamed protein product [Miscanthus lutarioriparius]|uniref:Uncharacterized protein n=1 Tax=Miscanthus lutarioriparius TaxID=422564 RepID=A0A811MIL5_9POAL|nr:unnamed protein product [Miscanthus lutarioriparius]
MLSSTVELITLWASSSSPSLLAFCFSHLIIAVLLLGGRGECTPGATEAGMVDGIPVQGGKRSGGGRESPPTAAASVVEHAHRHSCAHNVADVDTDTIQVQLQASEKSSGAEDDTVQEKCGGDDEEEDELMMWAEEFIRRMNRVWMAENMRFC